MYIKSKKQKKENLWIMRRFYIILQLPRVIASDYLYLRAKRMKASHHNKKIAELLDEDMLKYNTDHSGLNEPGLKMLNFCLISKPIFRTNFYFRINESKKLSKSVGKAISLILVPPLSNIEVGGTIDGSFRIVHKMGCVVVPHCAGKNLTVYQGSVVGYSTKVDADGINHATIGNNVTIFANACVCGGVHIGNNVVIAAGSVVINDVPDDCVVAGNPAKIIRRDGKRVEM